MYATRDRSPPPGWCSGGKPIDFGCGFLRKTGMTPRPHGPCTPPSHPTSRTRQPCRAAPKNEGHRQRRPPDHSSMPPGSPTGATPSGRAASRSSSGSRCAGRPARLVVCCRLSLHGPALSEIKPPHNTHSVPITFECLPFDGAVDRAMASLSREAAGPTSSFTDRLPNTASPTSSPGETPQPHNPTTVQPAFCTQRWVLLFPVSLRSVRCAR